MQLRLPHRAAAMLQSAQDADKAALFEELVLQIQGAQLQLVAHTSPTARRLDFPHLQANHEPNPAFPMHLSIVFSGTRRIASKHSPTWDISMRFDNAKVYPTTFAKNVAPLNFTTQLVNNVFCSH